MTQNELETWFITKISTALAMDETEIDIDVPFADFGLDSVAALQMTGELEKLLDKSLSATLMYDFPTIATLSEHLSAV